MSKKYIVFLNPKSTYRTPLRSDTLWGMICWGIRMVYGQNGEQMLNRYLDSCNNGNPEFLISSAFPWTEFKGKRTLFYPRPFLPIQKRNSDTQTDEERELAILKRKQLKEINLLPEDVFFKVLLGELAGKELDERLLADDLIIPKEDGLSVTHNTLDRKTWSTVKENEETSGLLFHSEEKYIDTGIFPNDDELNRIKRKELSAPRAGLFFLVDAENTELLKPALRYLQDTGIGGDRNTGKGFFEIDDLEEKNDWPQFENLKKQNAWLNLSLLYPKIEETNTLMSTDSFAFSYQLERRQGKIGIITYKKGLQKEPRMLFKEGSVFPLEAFKSSSLSGQISKVLEPQTDLGLNHPVYQNGMGFMLPVHIPNPNNS